MESLSPYLKSRPFWHFQIPKVRSAGITRDHKTGFSAGCWAVKHSQEPGIKVEMFRFGKPAVNFGFYHRVGRPIMPSN